MIDLHCHILPGVDDGPKNINESIIMAKHAVDEGINQILATPHHRAHGWFNEKSKIKKLVKEVQASLDEYKIPITILPGQEVRLYGEIIQDIEADKIQFIDEFNKYLLIEFPSATVAAYTEKLFLNLQKKDITPIIVHPERNYAIQKNPSLLKNLVDKGALSQLTAGSYLGVYGKNAKKLSKQLILSNLVHYIASDAHNTTNRSFHLKKTYEQIEKDFSPELVNYYQQTTRHLVHGELILPPTIKKKNSLDYFKLRWRSYESKIKAIYFSSL